MFFLSTTCISILQLIQLSIFAFISKIPTLSSNKSFSNIGLQSNFKLLIDFFNIELNKAVVMSSFPS